MGIGSSGIIDSLSDLLEVVALVVTYGALATVGWLAAWLVTG